MRDIQRDCRLERIDDPVPSGLAKWSKSISFLAEVKISHGQDRCADNQQKRDGVDDRGAAVAYLKIEVDGQSGLRAHQKQSGIEVFKGHQEGYRG